MARDRKLDYARDTKHDQFLHIAAFGESEDNKVTYMDLINKLVRKKAKQIDYTKRKRNVMHAKQSALYARKQSKKKGAPHASHSS